MKTLDLLLICLILIMGSVFIVPGIAYAGIDNSIATGLSSILLLAGIIAAVLTVNMDTKWVERRDDGKR